MDNRQENSKADGGPDGFVTSPSDVPGPDRRRARDSAGVRVPPPVYYLVGFLVGWAIDRWIGGPVVPPDASASARLVPGGVLVGAGLAIGLSAVWTIKRAGSNIAPMRPTTALVTTGPFRWSRNPIYLGLALCSAGVAVGLNLLWPLVVLPIVIWIIRRQVIAREELYLDRAFGREYRRYRERVPRWL